jgi:hypothetical protein
MDWHPDWYLNLKHMSEAKIEIGDKTFNVQAAVIFVCDLLLPAAVIGGLAG